MLAFLSKQNTASLPGAILLVEYLFVDRSWRGWKKKIPWFTVAFTLWFLFVLYVSGFFAGGHEGAGVFEDVSKLMQETDTVSRWSYLCTQFNVLVIYIRLLFLPIGQNLDYLYSFKSGFFDGYTPLAFLFLVGVVGIGIWNIKKRPVIAFGIFWFFITLSVESSIIPIRDALFEHRLYLATFGLALVASYLLFGLLLKKQAQAALIAVCIVLALMGTTYCRNIVWQDEMRLWFDVVSKNPKSCRGWNGLGNVFLKDDKPLEAIEQYIKALNNQPNYAVAWYNWGNALLRLDKPIEAIQKYKNALILQPGYADVLCNWGNALIDLGKPVEAIQKFREALNNRPGYAKAWYNWGNALVEINRSDEAVDKFERAVSIDPDHTKALGSLGAAYLLKGRTSEAAGLLEKAVRLNPEYVEAWCNLGIAFGMMGKLNQAISKIERAVNIKPDYVDGWLNWGAALVKMGMLEDAIEKYQKALSLNPEMPKVRNDINAIHKIIESRKKNMSIAG